MKELTFFLSPLGSDDPLVERKISGSFCSAEIISGYWCSRAYVALVGGGRAVYFPCGQTNVIQESTLGNFPTDLLVTGDKISKYTARPPHAPSHFRAGFMQFTV